MKLNEEIFVIAFVCAIVLFIVFFRRKTEILINFILRAVMGVIAVFFLNEFLMTQGIEVALGINPITVLTIGSLGFPGFAMLYGFLFYKLL